MPQRESSLGSGETRRRELAHFEDLRWDELAALFEWSIPRSVVHRTEPLATISADFSRVTVYPETIG